MAPADQYSAPGAARYDSDTMHVGDGTWDFEKNTFLLPNLAGLNFDTMRYNGMGNRFSTVTEYHNLIRAHAVIGAIVFLGLVPAAVFLARFYTRAPGYARHYHGILNGFVILLLTPVFILGWFAVGPNRSWTNPHHVIGLAVYIMFLLQLIGGRIVRNISGLRPSLRLTIHQWSGRLIALLGIIQVPLGLTLYGSPKFTFILFAVWMAILLLAYFILDFRAKRFRDDRGDGVYARGARSEGPMTESEFRTEHTEIREEKSGGKRWIAPLLAAGGLFAFMNRRKGNRSRSASPSRRGPEVLPSRRGSSSYIEETKYTDIDSRRGDNAPKTGGGGFMKGLFAGKLLSGVMNRQKEPVYADGYSAVSTETPPRGGKYGRRPGAVSEYSDYTVDARRNAGTESLLPPPGGPVMAAHAISAADERYTRPRTPTRVTHVRTQSGYGMEPSDYSSYVSPSRRPRDQQGGGGGGGGRVAAAGGGILATLGMGWLAKKFADRKARREEERRFREEDDLRSGVMSSRYTGDGYSSPSRVGARKPSGRRPPAASTIGTSVTGYTEDSSSRLEDRPSTTRFAGPPMPPLQAGKTPPQHVDMPPMPPDPHGVLHTRSYSSDAYSSPSRRPERRGSSRRRRAGERAAAVAAASAASTAAEAESYRRSEASRRADSTPVAVKVRVHDDKDRNVTLRRLTEEEAAASRRDQSRRRNDSLGSMSGTESTGRRRYRRDSSQRRAEQAAESAVSSVPPPPPGPPLGPPMGPPPGPPPLGAGLPPSAGLPPGSDLPPLSPPQPAFAGGRKPKDSAYYSGQPVPPQTPVGQPPLDASSIGSPESHGTWSGMSPSPSGPTNPAGGSVAASAAADNRRRRRLERRRSTSRRPTGADMFE
ncbi:hypothetical protein F5X68DRAFT_48700 [Plectosphaerella plurivora]|uniref:Cytochrome b561 domain-containing protein n=1 Tax=Plectosphaerella plurivora TaxID=936078 RepID=A0A9P8VI10_9PEZI|nr:hypothetical protein F5X68DRAFT_48700 [Plectosphaerella plurivora]